MKKTELATSFIRLSREARARPVLPSATRAPLQKNWCTRWRKNGLDALNILTSATKARAPVLEKINGFLSLFAESASESERKLTLAMEPSASVLCPSRYELTTASCARWHFLFRI
jgi:hypothetical protein